MLGFALLGFIDNLAERDRRGALELLVVLVLDDHLDLLRTALEGQRVVGVGINREPVVVVDLIAVGLESRKLLVVVASAHADALAIGLHDLQAELVDPDLALEIALALFHLLGLDREHVGLDLVYLLLAEVVDSIAGGFRSGHHERLHVPKVLHVVGGEDDLLQRVGRGVDDALDALAVRAEKDVLHQLESSPHAAGVAVLENLYRLTVGVRFAGLGELGLLVDEVFDDVLDRGSRSTVPGNAWSGYSDQADQQGKE